MGNISSLKTWLRRQGWISWFLSFGVICLTFSVSFSITLTCSRACGQLDAFTLLQRGSGLMRWAEACRSGAAQIWSCCCSFHRHKICLSFLNLLFFFPILMNSCHRWMNVVQRLLELRRRSVETRHISPVFDTLDGTKTAALVQVFREITETLQLRSSGSV